MLIEETKTQNKDKKETFDIRKGILDCSTNLVVYLIGCKSCFKQYVGSIITLFRSHFNNYKRRLEKCQKFISRNLMSIKNNFTVTLTEMDTMLWRTGRLLSLIGLKMF